MSSLSNAGRRTPPPVRAFIWLALILAWSGTTAPPVAAGASDPLTTDQWVLSILEAEKKYGEQWTVLVQDLESGRQVLAFKPDLALIPASNRKLITFALAIEKFGPEYRFITDLGLTHAQREPDGIVNANIVLRSQGDPSLTREFMNGKNPVEAIQEWIGRMAELGYRRIRGDFLIDASAFGPSQLDFPAAWEPKYYDKSYASLPTAVAINRNLLQVIADPSRSVSAPGSLEIYPTQDGLTILNRTVTKSGRWRGLEAGFDPVTGQLEAKGELGQAVRKQVVSLPHPRPLDYIRGIVIEALAMHGIELIGEVRIITDPDEGRRYPLRYLVARHESPPLPELLDQMMNDSDNFVAEQIWHATAFRSRGIGNTESARLTEAEWFRFHNLPDVEPGFDGSGLSRQNVITAADQLKVLIDVYNSPYGPYLLETLPVSGRRGTLKNRDLPYNRVAAKTGTLSGVTALTGFLRDKSGRERYAFSIVANAPAKTNGRLTKRVNQLMKILTRNIDQSGRPNLKRFDPATKVMVESPS